MKRTLSKLLSLTLALCLIVTGIPVFAEENGSLNNFVEVNSFGASTFTDVKTNDWFYSSVKKAYQVGLVKGYSEGDFRPNSNISQAEVVTIAAFIHSIYYNNNLEDYPPQPSHWASGYYQYLNSYGVLFPELFDLSTANNLAKRGEAVRLFARVLPDKEFATINQIADGDIPDVPLDQSYALGVYKFYRAGILAGNDSKGTFKPNSNITRAEITSIIGRMIDPSLRVKFTLEKPTPTPPTPAPSPSPATTVYWTPGGSKYHRKTCATLSNSKTIYNGSISQAGNRTACKVCKP